MVLNQHVKTEVTQVRGIDSNIQRRLGSEHSGHREEGWGSQWHVQAPLCPVAE